MKEKELIRSMLRGFPEDIIDHVRTIRYTKADRWRWSEIKSTDHHTFLYPVMMRVEIDVYGILRLQRSIFGPNQSIAMRVTTKKKSYEFRTEESKKVHRFLDRYLKKLPSSEIGTFYIIEDKTQLEVLSSLCKLPIDMRNRFLNLALKKYKMNRVVSDLEALAVINEMLE